ncbi:MAG: F0F1 ATP synthase subunit A [Deltaproteobacteria bacterium]|nr:F0F1 ATP synthase subunit A [Deltaproteobacteria bacterium]
MEHPVTWTGLLGIPFAWHSVATGVFVMLVLLVLAARARSALQADSAIIPDASLSPRNIYELLVESITGMAESVIGPGSGVYVPLLATFFVFILVSNLLGLVPGFSPPTSDFDITFALGIVSFLFFNYYGLKTQGMNYLKHFAGPVLWLAPLIFTLEIIGVFVRPFSLGLRLFGNMFGDHLVLEIFTGLTKVGIPVVFYFLGTLVSIIQAFVFMLLSTIYIALSVPHGDGHHH